MWPGVTEQLFLPSTFGLEQVLLAEVTELGLTARVTPGGVEVSGPSGTYEQLNLWSAIASRVLLRVAAVKQPGDLSGVALTPFGSAFTVEGDGRFADAARRRWKTGTDATIMIREEGGGATVSVDTSGELLYLRGYRQEIGRAPLRETLASGVLRLAGYDPNQPVWDVMCGSGTFLVEAALRALGKAPGGARKFAFETWPSHDAARFAAQPRTRPGVEKPRIFGSDLNAGALGTARRNARRANVFEQLTLERFDALTAKPPPNTPPGLLLANLPYGKRVGDERELPGLLAKLNANAAANFPGWRTAWLVPAGVESAARERVALRNGGIRCELQLG